jgi:hypothetical protein
MRIWRITPFTDGAGKRLISDVERQIVVYKDKADHWRWVLYSEQAKRLTESPNSHRLKAECVREARDKSPGTRVWNCTEGAWESS